MFFSYHVLCTTLIEFKTSLPKVDRMICAVIRLAGSWPSQHTVESWKLKIQVDNAAADDLILCWRLLLLLWLLLKLPLIQQDLVSALPSSQSLISRAAGRAAPISLGGTQAWSCFHGDKTYPRFRFHFVLDLNDILKEIVYWWELSAIWERRLEGKESRWPPGALAVGGTSLGVFV